MKRYRNRILRKSQQCLRPITLVVTVVISFLCGCRSEVPQRNRLAYYQGKLQQTIIDYEDGKVAASFVLIDSNDSQPVVDLSGNFSPPAEMVGMDVEVFGTLNDDQTLSVEEIQPLSSAAEVALYPARVTHGSGQRKVAFLRVEVAGESSCPADMVIDAMYTGPRAAAEFFRVNSRGQLTINGDADGNGQYDIFGPYRIATHHGSRSSGWVADVDPLARRDGVMLEQYDHIVYVLPQGSAPGAAWGEIGCHSQCRVYMYSCSAKVLAHELGHNIGLAHAASDLDNNGEIDNEYGDFSCMMGAGDSFFNILHQEQLGWLHPGEAHTVTESQTVTIGALDALAQDAGSIKSVKVPIPHSSPAQHYYLSYRTNAHATWPVHDNHLGGVNIHRQRHLDWPDRGKTLFVKRLTGSDSSWRDPQAQITVHQRSTTDDHVVVEIALGSQTAERPHINPLPSPSPPTTTPRADPSLQFVNLADRTTLSGTVQLEVDIAAGSYPLARAHVYLDRTLLQQMSRPGNYQIALATDQYANGSHHIWGQAIDSEGFIGASLATVMFQNQSGPSPSSLTLTAVSPLPNQVVNGILRVEVQAESGTAIDRVEFFIDGRKISTRMSSPHFIVFDTATYPNGPHQIVAKAYDRGGHEAELQIPLQFAN